MKYVFEDNENDLIARFFRSAYPEDVSREFIYTHGNGNLKNQVENIIKNTDDENIVVFLDMIPDNIYTIEIYKELKKISKCNSYRIIVLPVVCTEYYLIKSLLGTPAIKDYRGIKICTEKGIWHDSPAIVSKEEKIFCKNFEKYCKLLAAKNLRDCAMRREQDNDMYGIYYNYDCCCHINNMECNFTKGRCTKAIDLLRQYPCVPEGSFSESLGVLSVDTVWNIHGQLVKEFNDMVEIYSEADKTSGKRYQKIREIR